MKNPKVLEFKLPKSSPKEPSTQKIIFDFVSIFKGLYGNLDFKSGTEKYRFKINGQKVSYKIRKNGKTYSGEVSFDDLEQLQKTLSEQ